MTGVDAAVEPAETISVDGHELSVFVETQPLVAAMLADVRQATSRVWIETYWIVPDDVGRRIAEALAERARAGVDVRLMYDSMGSQFTPSSFFAELERAGVEVHAYHTLWEAIRHRALFDVLNRRNHRKLMVVDECIAYFGGMNLVDLRTSASPQAPDPKAIAPDSPADGWRDVHVRLCGPKQSEIAAEMDRQWKHVRERRSLHRAAQRWPRRKRHSRENIQFYASGPGTLRTGAARVFRRLIRRSTRQITFLMAYFIPAGFILRRLLRARQRGVEIQIIVPGKSDVRLVGWATSYLYARLLTHGFALYERQRRMLHSKVMVVDVEWTVVGSCNLDPRSLWLNHEFLAVIRSRRLAEEMQRICEHEIAHSRRVSIDDVRRRGWVHRALAHAAYWLRWWL